MKTLYELFDAVYDEKTSLEEVTQDEILSYSESMFFLGISKSYCTENQAKLIIECIVNYKKSDSERGNYSTSNDFWEHIECPLSDIPIG